MSRDRLFVGGVGCSQEKVDDVVEHAWPDGDTIGLTLRGSMKPGVLDEVIGEMASVVMYSGGALVMNALLERAAANEEIPSHIMAIAPPAHTTTRGTLVGAFLKEHFSTMHRTDDEEDRYNGKNVREVLRYNTLKYVGAIAAFDTFKVAEELRRYHDIRVSLGFMSDDHLTRPEPDDIIGAAKFGIEVVQIAGRHSRFLNDPKGVIRDVAAPEYGSFNPPAERAKITLSDGRSAGMLRTQSS